MSVCQHVTEDGVCLLHSEPLYKEPCHEGPCTDYQSLTNGDRIRAMTDEELAEWLGNCFKYWFNWLQQEVEE